MFALYAKIEELREVTAIANGTLKDIKAARKEASAVIEDLQANIHQKIADAVKIGLDEFDKSVLKAIDDCEERINRRFDKLGNVLMGEEGKDGKPPLIDTVREWMERRT